jgi:hypothetical protein
MTGASQVEAPSGVWIVVAWSDMSGTELTGRYLGRYRQVPERRIAEQVYACTWSAPESPERRAEADDFVAERAAEDDVVRAAVFVFPASEEDPLSRARRELLATATKLRGPR